MRAAVFEGPPYQQVLERLLPASIKPALSRGQVAFQVVYTLVRPTRPQGVEFDEGYRLSGGPPTGRGVRIVLGGASLG